MIVYKAKTRDELIADFAKHICFFASRFNNTEAKFLSEPKEELQEKKVENHNDEIKKSEDLRLIELEKEKQKFEIEKEKQNIELKIERLEIEKQKIELEIERLKFENERLQKMMLDFRKNI